MKAKKGSHELRTRVFETKISQLDALLKDGGIVIPENADGISILIKGPAGAGKSTLALLLATKCAKDGGPVLYCALEQSDYSLKRLAKSLDMDEKGWQWLQENDKIPNKKNSNGFVYLTNLQLQKKHVGEFQNYLDDLTDQVQNYITPHQKEKIGIIIIDSLDVFGRKPVDRLEFELLRKTLSAKNRILIFIGESEENELIWDRLVDMVIDLDRRASLGEYFLRTITISKARFQNHILGSHVIKIKGRGSSALPGDRIEASASDQTSEFGFFIYPSLHYHLSVAIERQRRFEIKQKTSSSKKMKYDAPYLKTGFEVLDHALGGGVKRGTMTAISCNLSYAAKGIGLSFLAKGVENGEKSLYLSLQDDENSIMRLPSDKNIHTMVKDKDLVIKSFRPGFISAEEFVDKIISEILDPTRQNAIFQRVLFDDVSQIALRFPLLDNAPVFLPTLMDIFKLYDMTAMFLSTTVTSGDRRTLPKNNLYDLVNTVIEVQSPDNASELEAAVHIRKIAEQFYIPQELRLVIDQLSGGNISIKDQEPATAI
ncbi:MAG TPA: ATPase domain-containing protein [Anaerolineales bacterium]|nr:ATPase domain-containing protein [Anaerolineales bacterium]